MKVKVKRFGIIEVVNGKISKDVKEHQESAIKAMTEKIVLEPNRNFSGLLVMPTGSGKTFTAAYWLLRNAINNNIKVLWIAHRHELLNQALKTFIDLSYSEILPNKSEYQYRIISGNSEHDRPVNIEREDDLIISSKDSIQKEGLVYLINKWVKHQKSIILVIDEAHHTPAKSYRFIIDNIRDSINNFKILGLTATPFRTSEKEKGMLKQIFPDDIVYKMDLTTLIGRGILAEPSFIEVATEYLITNDLSENDLKQIKQFDLPEKIKRKLAEHKGRNRRIIDEYLSPSKKEINDYGQTIVFALDVNHAIALTELFNANNIKSKYVVSAVKDMTLGVTISEEENNKAIADFRENKIQVLVNVEMLTEGFDAPQAQTVFLTRPTISTNLMTQMIGRVLRGPGMNGTKNANIVSFLDDWKDKISWVSPERLCIGNTDITDESNHERNFIRLISISKIQEFARLMDRTVNTEELELYPAIERIPIGVYSFILENDKNCDILIYNHNKQAFDLMIQDLHMIFKEADLDQNLELDDNEINAILSKLKEKYFKYCDDFMFRDEDVSDILKYYSEKSIEPPFFEFKDREKYNVGKLVQDVINGDFGPKKTADFLHEAWKEPSYYRLYFGNNFNYFKREFDVEMNRRLYSTEMLKEINSPVVKYGEVDIKKLSLQQIKKINYDLYKKISDEVYQKYTNKEGYYFSAISDFQSKYRMHFQIDHIKPMSKGGLTEIENLQLISRRENIKKGSSF